MSFICHIVGGPLDGRTLPGMNAKDWPSFEYDEYSPKGFTVHQPGVERPKTTPMFVHTYVCLPFLSGYLYVLRGMTLDEAVTRILAKYAGENL